MSHWSPDFLWESSGRVDASGYSAEMKIPLKSLRFPESEVQDWGIQIQRTIRRTGYESSWAPITQERANKLEQAGLGEGGGITTVRQQGYRFSIDTLD